MPVQTQAENYRCEAKRCIEKAEAARNLDTKKAQENMALEWLELAKRADEEAAPRAERRRADISGQ
jgi:hypothetical protein